ncbi:MAG: hypothetical protein KC777_05250 [Cyanobacteria bacterium HKST-UBA02]|nr:hypothetical protein [Cyanobacteria bacterium HKST-UBA02]
MSTPAKSHLALAVLLAAGMLAGCSRSPIEVIKDPLKIETRYIEDATDRTTIPLGEDEEAITKWKFGCRADIDFDITSKEIVDPNYIVSIKVTGVRMRLDAPVTIWVSKDSPAETLKHEQAHALICSRVYKNADSIARQAARTVLGNSYQASGKTLDAACKAAVDRVAEEVCELYHLKAVESINRVSEVFDGLEQHDMGKTPEQMVDTAFSQYVDITEKRPERQEDK